MMLGTGTIVINKIEEVFVLTVKETDIKQLFNQHVSASQHNHTVSKLPFLF